MKNILTSAIGLSAITSLFTLGLPSSPVFANQFHSCTKNLISTGITPEAASSACASAISPQDLGLCVKNIESDQALDACFQVRRPQDLASCVNRIDPDPELLDKVLDNCRKTLLPKRYARCVIGVRTQIVGIGFEQALDNCLDGLDYPTAIFPNQE
jgi:hypothetical protein